MQISLPGVPKAKQGREVAQQWEWTEASVWTERMLTALERGVKGGKWFSLMDKVWKMENLQSAMQQVVRNQGAAASKPPRANLRSPLLDSSSSKRRIFSSPSLIPKRWRL